MKQLSASRTSIRESRNEVRLKEVVIELCGKYLINLLVNLIEDKKCSVFLFHKCEKKEEE